MKNWIMCIILLLILAAREIKNLDLENKNIQSILLLMLYLLIFLLILLYKILEMIRTFDQDREQKKITHYFKSKPGE